MTAVRDDLPNKLSGRIFEGTAIHSDVDDVEEDSDQFLDSEENEDKIDRSIDNFVLLTEDDAARRIKPAQNIDKKRFELLRTVERDGTLVDLKISTYVASVNGNNLKPFPEHIVDETPEGLQGLLMINDLIPSVEILKTRLKKGDSVQLNDQVVNLVHWLIIQLKQPKLVEVPYEERENVFGRVEAAINLLNPSCIFKIMVNNLSSNHLQWQTAKGATKTQFAFCDVQAPHVHSLLHLGLYPFRKVHGPQGLGIYLTTDLKSCLDNSPPAWVWGKSAIGTRIQTAAIVEFIPCESKVTRYRDSSSQETIRPYHYFVQHNHLIQARYLLVYVKDCHKIDNPAMDYFAKRKGIRKRWRKIALIVSYLAICAASWKAFKGSPGPHLWYHIAEKMYQSPHFRHFLPFLQTPTLT